MSKRKALSKGLRFNIFRRDGFTCQYCGQQPPEIVLEVDHVKPVVEGGTNDEMNLVASCRDCNRGKGKKLLESGPRPDADLAWLEMQQELAELRRYQDAKLVREEMLACTVKLLQQSWRNISDLDWDPASHEIRKMLVHHAPEVVEAALITVAPKVKEGYISGEWLRYTWGVLKKMQADADGL